MLARNSTSAAREAADSFGFQPANTFSYVSSVAREFRSQPYSPAQKNVRPPMMRSTSARSCPSRSEDHPSSLSPKSSPTGPTTRTRSKKHAARAK